MGTGNENKVEISISEFSSKTVTGSAIGSEAVLLANGKLDIAKLIADCKAQAVKSLETKLGVEEVKAADVEVKCVLSGKYNLEESNGVIKVKETTTTGKTDTITVTLTYDNHSYTKTIKVTS